MYVTVTAHVQVPMCVNVKTVGKAETVVYQYALGKVQQIKIRVKGEELVSQKINANVMRDIQGMIVQRIV